MNNLKIKISDVTTTNDSITVPVLVENFSDIAAFNLSIGYDPNYLIIADKPELLFKDSGNTAMDTVTSGLIKFGWYTYPALTLVNNAILMNLKFKKIKSGTTKLIFISDGGFANASYEMITNTEYINGVIELKDEIILPIEPIEELPTFETKSKVSERKEIVGYVSKQVIIEKCGICKRRSSNKCSLGNFSTTVGGICDYFKY